jgi:hypothetical protein
VNPETDLRIAYDALTDLVRREYPAGLSLSEIAATWGDGITPEQVRAIRRLETRRNAPAHQQPDGANTQRTGWQER